MVKLQFIVRLSKIRQILQTNDNSNFKKEQHSNCSKQDFFMTIFQRANWHKKGLFNKENKDKL